MADERIVHQFEHATAENAGLPPLTVKILLHNWRGGAVAEANIGPEEAMVLARNILALLSPSHIAREAAAGDCPTCANTRLVNVPPKPGWAHGTNERCPDCGDRFDAKPLQWPSNADVVERRQAGA